MMQALTDGLVSASFIALGVIGLSFIYNILNFASFAHGDSLTVGGYLALVVVGLAGTAGSIAGLGFGWPLILGAGAAAVLSAALALMIDRVVYARLRRRSASRITLIMASFGVGLMLRNVITMIAGSEPAYYAFAIRPALRLGPVRVAPNDLVVVAVTAVVVALIHLLLARTRLGKSMRAVAESPELARINGIDVDAVIRWTWGIGSALAALAGVLFGLAVQLQPNFGFELLLPMFAALIVGGVTSVYGAILGAVVIGIAESLTVRYGAPEYRQAVSFLAIILILTIRPQGLIGERR